jgi:menaquinone-specific isochorismate synthase
MNTQAKNKEEFLSNLTNVKQVFLSFAAKISPINFNLLLNHFANKPDDVIFFSQPDKNIIFISYDELAVHSFNQNEFHLINQEIDILKSKLISNYDEFPGITFPVFIITSKFPGSKTSNEWSDFGQTDFLIPKIALFKHSNDYFIIYNTLTESFSSHENLNDLLEKQIEKIYALESKITELATRKAKISFIEQSDDIISWGNKINSAIKSIEQKEIGKIVLSRRLKFNCEEEINWKFIFDELDEKYPGCTNFLLKSNDAVFFGSTPELLARFNGNEFFTESLAGSIMRGDNEVEDSKFENELLKSEKNKIEHDAVTNHLIDVLNNYLDNVQLDNNTTVKKLFSIQHLQTGIRGKLKKNVKVLDLLSSFFPTPAVCGIPKDKAINLISQSENFERGLYAGFFGWLDFNGNGELNVSIRSALLKNKNLYAYAGCGIVEGSDPDEEFEETNLKLKPILSLFENAD